MANMTKGKSPFYPGQPVPVELFVGRAEQIDRIVQRGVGQVALGKPMALFIQGEYGIGKSSIANFTQWAAERDYYLYSIYAPLGGCSSLTDVAQAILEGVVRSGALDPRRLEKMGNLLAKYMGKQELFGLSIDFEALKKDSPGLSTPFGLLSFLMQVWKRLREDGTKGIYLVLDEINGITANPEFAHFIKGLVDTNAAAREPLPLLLTLCGVEEKRREMIRAHQPIDRLFDPIDVAPMNAEEGKEFFRRAFRSVQIEAEDEALDAMAHYCAGFPKIMHLVGDAAYWRDKDGKIDNEDAIGAVLTAADEVGKKYVDQQVYKALRSKDYHAILSKIAKMGPDAMSFTKKEVEAGLNEQQRKKLNNFLQRMKKLKVLRSGEVAGEYLFNVRMVRLYIWLQATLQRA